MLTPSRTIVQIGWEQHIPVLEAADLTSEDTIKTTTELKPDVIAVACFDRLIPSQFRALARLAVNVHPSLLPENRGPAPLFWTFRLGLRETGVTVHVLEDRADAGVILAQREVPVPDGIDGAVLDYQLAQTGGELLIETLRQFEAGTLLQRPQDESRATVYAWPTEADWLIPADWPERREANFTRGVAYLGGPLRTAPD
jgi:methionyl-tRNA formyltransferase